MVLRAIRFCVPAVCDRDRVRLEHMTQVYPGVKGCRDLDEVLRDPSIDAAAIATPVKTHHGIARALLDAGKHVFLEKPMAASVAECRDLLARAAAKKLRLMVGHTFVYTSAVRKIKELVDSGEIGEVQYISSRRLNLGLLQKDVNVAWDLAPHDISIIQAVDFPCA